MNFLILEDPDEIDTDDIEISELEPTFIMDAEEIRCTLLSNYKNSIKKHLHRRITSSVSNLNSNKRFIMEGSNFIEDGYSNLK